MKRATNWITVILLIAIAIYACSPGPFHLINNTTTWEFREQFVFFTGTCAMLLMILSILISVRWPWLNQKMHGLDKAYVIHKWTGIFSSIFMLAHFLLEKVPHWLVESGLVANPGELTDAGEYSDIEITLFQSGTVLIEFVFYIVMLLVLIALIKKVPYKTFRKTHKAFPFVFLLVAFHVATAPLKERWFETPAGYILLTLIIIGTIAALIGVFQMIGYRNSVAASIIQIDYHSTGITDISLRTSRQFFHEPGQYAFLRFEHDGEPHPFTIASSDNEGHTLRFAVKDLGDFSGSLKDQLKPGHAVEVEGPYGEFKFHLSGQREIWIAGGIGITPFLARLEYLTQQKDKRRPPIDFWYCTRGELIEQFPTSLETLCVTAGVNLHHLNSGKKEYLTAKVLHDTVPSLENVNIWFCGPEDFGKRLLTGLKKYNVSEDLFHYDDFSMR